MKILLPIAFISVFLGIGEYKYIISVLSATIIYLYNKKNLTFNKSQSKLFIYLLLPSIFCILYMLIGILIGDFNFYKEEIKNIIFKVLPIIISFIIIEACRFKQVNINSLFRWSLYGYIFNYLMEIHARGIANIHTIESSHGFIFVVFALYYFMIEKNNINLLISILIIISCGKRTLFYILILIIILYYLFKLITKKCRSYKYIIVISTIISLFIISIFYIYLIRNDILNNILLKNGILDSGRNYVWSFFRNDYFIDISYLGKGMGFVDNKLAYIGNKSFGLLHNDILKNYIEIGMIGTLINLILIFIIIFRFKDKSLIIFINQINIITFLISSMDNIQIYISYLLPMYSIIFILNREHSNYRNT